MAYIELGTKLHYNYLQNNGRPTLVFLHGLALKQSMWNRFIKAYSKDYAILAVDLRGHGQSSVPQKGYKVNDFLNDILGIVKELNIADPIFIGFSLGGVIAYEASRKAGSKPACLISTPSSYKDIKKSFFVKVKISSKLPKVLYKALPAGERGRIGIYIKALSQTPSHVIEQIIHGFKSYAGIGKIGAEHLVILAENDEIICNKLENNASNIVKVEGTHYSPISNYENTAKIISTWLSGMS